MLHEANLRFKYFAEYTRVVHKTVKVSFFRNFAFKRLPFDDLKVAFFFTIFSLPHILMQLIAYTYLTTSSLMANLIVVSNSEFFMLFRTSSYIFGAKNTRECAIFTD